MARYVLILFLVPFNSWACYKDGINPDYAWFVFGTSSYYADLPSACNALATTYSGCKAGSDLESVTEPETCKFVYTQPSPCPIGTNHGGSVQRVSGSTAYGICETPEDNTAGICQDGQITATYSDPNCLDGSIFDNQGNFIHVGTDINIDVDTQTQTTYDETSDQTTEIVTETTTTTTTTTWTNQDGTTYDQTEQIDETVNITTNIYEGQGNGGTLIQSSTDSTSTSDGESNTGFGSASGSCDVAPTCSGDAVNCAILFQTWESSCAIEQAISGGSGETSVSGGGDCATAPVCSGDPINCAILTQSWHDRCDLANDDYTPDTTGAEFNLAVPVDNDLSGEIDSVLSQTPEFSSTCPAPYAINLGLGSFDFDYQPMCSFASGISPLVLAVAGFFAVRIYGRALTT